MKSKLFIVQLQRKEVEIRLVRCIVASMVKSSLTRIVKSSPFSLFTHFIKLRWFCWPNFREINVGEFRVFPLSKYTILYISQMHDTKCWFIKCLVIMSYTQRRLIQNGTSFYSRISKQRHECRINLLIFWKCNSHDRRAVEIHPHILDWIIMSVLVLKKFKT